MKNSPLIKKMLHSLATFSGLDALVAIQPVTITARVQGWTKDGLPFEVLVEGWTNKEEGQIVNHRASRAFLRYRDFGLEELLPDGSVRARWSKDDECVWQAHLDVNTAMSASFHDLHLTWDSTRVGELQMLSITVASEPLTTVTVPGMARLVDTSVAQTVLRVVIMDGSQYYPDDAKKPNLFSAADWVEGYEPKQEAAA